MADTKVSALGALTTPASGDRIPIVDVSDTTQAASGSTKYVTWANFFTAPSFATSFTFDSITFTSVQGDGTAVASWSGAAPSEGDLVAVGSGGGLEAADTADITLLPDVSSASASTKMLTSTLELVSVTQVVGVTGQTINDPKVVHGVNAQTGTTYTLVLADAGKLVTMNNASANTLTIPTNASVALPVGTAITIAQIGAGTTSIAGDTGVTLNGVSAGSGDVSAQYGFATIVKIATDTWLAGGAIGTVA